MSCCGGVSSAAAQASGRALIDEQAAAGAVVKLVYTGADRRSRAYVAEGKVYHFGNNDRRRVNGVAARVAPMFLEPGGRYAGEFALFDPALYTESGERVVAAGEQEGVPQEIGSEAAASPASTSSGDASAGTPAAKTKGAALRQAQGPAAKSEGD